MTKESQAVLEKCLYFTAGALARQLNVLADECFRPTGLNPSQGFALMCIVEEPSLHPSVIAKRLVLAPSSVTRIIELLVKRGYATTTRSGRLVSVDPTSAGEEMYQSVMQAWQRLHQAYADVLGLDEGDDLCARVHRAVVSLESR